MMTRGTELSPSIQRHVLASYVHRFTGEHKPRWAAAPRPDGTAYQVQFQDDRDWLANTHFQTTKSGTLDRRVTHCQSNPTWPNLMEVPA